MYKINKYGFSFYDVIILETYMKSLNLILSNSL